MLLFAIQFLWWTILKIEEFVIRSTNNPLIDIFLYSHHLFAWCCIDIWWEIGPENFPLSLELWSNQVQTWNNHDLMTGIFQYLILLCFTLSSHWLPVIFSFVLIGHYHNSNKTFVKKKKKNTQIVHVPISSCLLVVHSLTMSSGVTPSTPLNLLVNNLNHQ